VFCTIQTLGEYIRRILRPRDIVCDKLALGNNISHEMVPKVEMLCADMKDRILDGFEGTIRIRIYHEEPWCLEWRLVFEDKQLVTKFAKPEGFFGCEANRNCLGFHRGLCNERLFLGRVCDRWTLLVKEETIAGE